jgi:prevent-host-death family protein
MVDDHGIFGRKRERGVTDMEEIAISKFKAKCLAVVERVRKTRKPIRITRFGKPVAEVVPPSTPPHPGKWLGSLKSTGVIRGDIVSPVSEEADWEILKP